MPGVRARPQAGLGEVVAAAVLWGTYGLFVRVFQAYGLSAADMAFWRAATGAATTLLMLLVTGRAAHLRVSGPLLGRLALYGLLSTALFPFAYFTAIAMLPLAVAGILLYTAPVWVVLLAAPLFGEALTGRKLAAVALALGGAALVAGLGPTLWGGGSELSVSWTALGAGLLAGLTYALLSLGGKWLGRAAPVDTIMFYAYLAGAVTLGLLAPGAWRLPAAAGPQLWLAIGLMGLGPTFLAYRLFLRGLEKLEASVAGIVATLEPVVVAVLGWLVMGETLTGAQLAGGLLVLAAVVLLQLPVRPRGDRLSKQLEARGL